MLSETADLTEGVNMQTLIKFGSFTPISPRSYAVQRSDLDSEDSGRSETGVMFRNRIRAGVYKIQVTWRVNRSQLSAIANAISPDSFSVTFFDPTTASTKTCTMYLIALSETPQCFCRKPAFAVGIRSQGGV